MSGEKASGPSVRWGKILKAVGLIIVCAVVFGGIGYWYGTGVVEETEDVATITPASSTTATTSATISATADETADWKTYTNEEYGFSLQIPSNYSIQEEYSCDGASGVILKFGKNTTTGVSTYNRVSLNYFLVQDLDLDRGEKNFKASSGDFSNRKLITIGEKDGIRYELGGLFSGTSVISTDGNASLEIKVYPDNDENTEFFNKLIDSFRF